MRRPSRAVRPLFMHMLALCSACSGNIEPLKTDVARSEVDAGSPRDAGHSSRSASATPHDASAVADAAEHDAGALDAADAQVEPEDAGPLDASADVTDARTGDADTLHPCSNGRERPLARGLKISELALYQSVKVSLYQDGAWASDNEVPVIAQKKTTLRVFVNTAANYAPHDVLAVLTLDGAQGEMQLQDEARLTADSSDDDLASTFTFDVDGSAIDVDTAVSVTLYETDCSASPGAASDTRVPASGSHALEAEATGTLKVVLVPVSVGGRLPTLDATEQTRIHDALLAYYPVAHVDVSVRAQPFTYPSSLSGSNPNAWSDLLNDMMKQRAADRVDADVYYFGIMQPASTFAAYCNGTCQTGLSSVPTRVSPSSQVSLGVYFTDKPDVTHDSLKTIAHELGHAHGRNHAPCVFKGGTISGVDSAFPDRTGATTEWGWDSRTSTLLPPSDKDIMGYCSPDWISPYTYAAIAQRSLQVNGQPLLAGGPALTTWHNVLVYSDGSTRWGGITETSTPGGQLETAAVLDSAGAQVASTTIVRLALSDSSNEILYLPDTPATWAKLVLSDRELDLRTIQPAR